MEDKLLNLVIVDLNQREIHLKVCMLMKRQSFLFMNVDGAV